MRESLLINLLLFSTKMTDFFVDVGISASAKAFLISWYFSDFPYISSWISFSGSLKDTFIFASRLASKSFSELCLIFFRLIGWKFYFYAWDCQLILFVIFQILVDQDENFQWLRKAFWHLINVRIKYFFKYTTVESSNSGIQQTSSRRRLWFWSRILA